MPILLDPDRLFLISPPFGSYFRHGRAYSMLGSFTTEPRPGRTGQVLRRCDRCPAGRSGCAARFSLSTTFFWPSRAYRVLLDT